MATPQRTFRRLLVALGAIVGLLVLALVALVVLVDEDALAARVRDRVLPEISERIGRKVTAGPIDVEILPPGLRVEAVSVAGVSERPLAFAGEVVARPDLWALVRSFGREIRLRAIEVRDAEVNVIKLPSGEWAYEAILERLEQRREAEGAGGGAERRLAIDRLHLRDGTVRIVDQSAPGGAAVAELRGIELSARNVGPGLPLSVEARAALQSERHNLTAAFTVDPLPADLDALGPGNYPTVTGTLEVDDAPLRSLRNLLPAGLGAVTTGGQVRLGGAITTENERYVATGTGALRELQLRGQPAEGSFAYRAELDPASKALQLSLQELVLRGPGIDLGGTASLNSAPLRFEFALAGPLLDLDTLLGALPREEAAEEGAAEEPVVPPAVRNQLQAAEGKGTLRVDRLVSGRLTATDVVAEAQLRGGNLTLRQAEASFYGGKVQAAGTTANLAAELPTWKLQATLEAVDLGAAMRAIAGAAPLDGKVSSRVDLAGAGVDWEVLRSALTGAVLLGLDDGRLATLSLDRALDQQVAAGLRRLGQNVAAERVESGIAATTLDQLRTRIDVDDGWMILREPITVRTAFGSVQIAGRVGLDWRLDLRGSAVLRPDYVARLTGGRLRPAGPVTLPLDLGGTLQQPTVAQIDTDAIARSLLPTGRIERRAQQEAERGKKQVEREARRRVEDALRGVF